MGVYKRGDTWWYRFKWRGEVIRESTRQSNKRMALQIEAARKTELARGEVGLKDLQRTPTLGEFATTLFIPHIETSKADKVRTVEFYKFSVKNLLAFPSLADSRLNEIDVPLVDAFIRARRAAGLEISTVNRELAALRRLLRLAVQWGTLPSVPLQVRLLPGENRRERVLSFEEEEKYLATAPPLLADFAILSLDTGLRPEEAHALLWSQYRDGCIEVHRGKTSGARRSIPASPRVQEMLQHRRAGASSPFVFPAQTKTGHMSSDSIKGQHKAALAASKLQEFVPYTFRHTCLTRWARAGMSLWDLKKLAGHENLTTTQRYIHMSAGDSRKALEGLWEAQRGHKSGHTPSLASITNFAADN